MKTGYMSSVFTVAILLMASGQTLAAGPVCAESQADTWMEPEAVLEKAETIGMTVENMSLSEGNCYQLSGLNSEGKSMIAYLDPQTGEVMQEEVSQ